MYNNKIGTIEAIMLILTIIIAHTVLAMPTDILSNYKSSSILNLIYVSIFAVFLSYLIYRLFKNFPSMDIIDISETIGGKVFKNIIGFIFISYFIISSSIILGTFVKVYKFYIFL